MALVEYMHCKPQLLLQTVANDNAIFLELAEIFLSESVALYQNMAVAAAIGDWDTLGKQSHALKGTIGPVGADALVQMLQNIENDCRKYQRVCDADLLAQIDRDLAQAREEMRHFIAHLDVQ